MQKAGIQTDIFKAHSLRGATATHLLRQGVSMDLIQGRGQWASKQTLDQYYARLHQHQEWQHLLLGEPDEAWQSASCAVFPPKNPKLKPTTEGEKRGFEEESNAQAAELYAQGVLRPLFDTKICPS